MGFLCIGPICWLPPWVFRWMHEGWMMGDVESQKHRARCNSTALVPIPRDLELNSQRDFLYLFISSSFYFFLDLCIIHICWGSSWVLDGCVNDGWWAIGERRMDIAVSSFYLGRPIGVRFNSQRCELSCLLSSYFYFFLNLFISFMKKKCRGL